MKSEEKIKDWLLKKLAEESGQGQDELNYDTRFDSLDLDSLSAISIAYDLESYLKVEINPTALTEFQTINELTEWLMNPK